MIETVADIASTNGELLARLGRGEHPVEGYWLVADRQSAGRGRAGRAWSDGHGNFMGSTVVHLNDRDPQPQTLALVAGVAAHQAVIACAPQLQGLLLKWPNDLLLDEAKLGGILLERHGSSVVIGIGINLVQAPQVPDRRTTSLADHHCDVPRDRFATELAVRLRDAVDRWHYGEWPMLRQQWIARAVPAGSLVSVRDRDQSTITGSFAGIDDDGVALMRLADGTVRAIHAGDIEMVGSNAPRG
ncbi:MAG: biotin--[acetyl-CoA-carboxylase] ligase [Novosphingobium meiothermophilum]|uniref:biotin--[acetyl-CoA-carboxylase] ligase n=1 Tax=Novosphingobium TaxID=165696 RepID=UPI000D6E00BB|nr:MULTISPECIES: biotin--[acetyl-CoA-carboxylase] ligase [Novosphingobium]